MTKDKKVPVDRPGHAARRALLKDVQGAEKAFLSGKRNRSADLESVEAPHRVIVPDTI